MQTYRMKIIILSNTEELDAANISAENVKKGSHRKRFHSLIFLQIQYLVKYPHSIITERLFIANINKIV